MKGNTIIWDGTNKEEIEKLTGCKFDAEIIGSPFGFDEYGALFYFGDLDKDEKGTASPGAVPMVIPIGAKIVVKGDKLWGIEN